MTNTTTLRWRPLEGAGLEHCEVAQTGEAITAKSVLIGSREGLEFGVTYELRLDPDWTFRSLTLQRLDGAGLALHSDGRGRWIDGSNTHLEALEGCIDLDISGTPLTNTLPIRRVPLTIGSPAAFRMAWVPLDTLTPFASVQVYTRLSDRRYRYRSGDGSFSAKIETDAEGFVRHYEGLFDRL